MTSGSSVWRGSIHPLGDRALTLTIVHASADVPPRDAVRCLAQVLRDDPVPGVLAIVPALETVTLHYDPLRVAADVLSRTLLSQLDVLQITPAPVTAPIVIPVCYGGEFGPDLDDVAARHNTTPDAIVARHVAGTYTVAMLGFLPGFPYLDGLDSALYTPRRNSPRTRVPAGSVGIGGTSTGIYPCESPGGWNLIGRTPRPLFDPARENPSLLLPGDTVRFEPMRSDEYLRWREPA